MKYSFLVLADTQVAHQSHLDEPKTGYTRFDEHSKFFDFVIQYAVKHKANFIAHAGDVFDSHGPDNYSRNLFSKFVTQVIEHNMFLALCLGNHDGTRDDNPLTNVQILASKSIFISPFDFTRDELRFVSYDWSAYKSGGQIPTVGNQQRGNFLFGHAPVAGAYMNPSYKVRDHGLVASKSHNYEAMFFGHYHFHQQLDHIFKVPSFYVGSSIKEDFGEIDQPKGFMFVTVTDEKVEVKHVGYPDVPFVQASMDAEEVDADLLLAKIPRDRRVIFKLKIRFTERSQISAWDRKKVDIAEKLYKEGVLKFIPDPYFESVAPTRSRDYAPSQSDHELSSSYLKSEKPGLSKEEEKEYVAPLGDILK